MYWEGYRSVNQTFAEAVDRVSGKNSLIWAHDYHLMLLAQAVRSRGMRQRTAYFHHIPFPSPDVFETLPWRKEVLTGLLQFDAIGFQTIRDRYNFIACVDRIGEVQAWNVDTGERAWTHTYAKSPNWGPMLATGGGLVFSGGTNDRMFHAFDASSGKLLWQFPTNSGILGQPTSFSIDGKQYIAVQFGWGIVPEAFKRT